ncbi:MAG TPA: hypothetical protein VMU17_00080 [Elusimicrobiota bacterium]|nr:hypothetical protein [Elusimicrobiota bacterium]
MKKIIGLALALGFVLVAPAANAVEHATTQPKTAHPHKHHHHARQAVEPQTPARPPVVVEEPAPPPAGLAVRPYSQPGEGNNDGLSRDPDDCNMSCIDGNPD